MFSLSGTRGGRGPRGGGNWPRIRVAFALGRARPCFKLVVHGRRWRRPLRRTPGCGNVSTNVYHQFEGREAGLAPIKSLWAAMTIFCFHGAAKAHASLIVSPPTIAPASPRAG